MKKDLTPAPSKKLFLQKKTIVRFDPQSMDSIRGGLDLPLPGTISPTTGVTIETILTSAF